MGLVAGVAALMPNLPSQGAWAMGRAESEQYIDTALFWRESSGPRGERNPTALPLYEAVFAHDARQVRSLLDRGASPNALLYPGGWSALMVAIAYNDHAVARLLVKHGADLNYVSNDPATGTPLAVALSYGRFYTIEHPDFSMFRYVLNSGADINVEFHGEDIAIYAVVLGRIAFVNEFLTRGYHHDLPQLKTSLEVRQVVEGEQSEKDKALATIGRLLMR
jgi:ankyrin repeat protein